MFFTKLKERHITYMWHVFSYQQKNKTERQLETNQILQYTHCFEFMGYTLKEIKKMRKLRLQFKFIMLNRISEA